jgi:Domain of Unknown Function (DUF1080)
MRRTIVLVSVLAAFAAAALCEDGPQPRVVDPGGPGKAPADAVVLFDGTSLSHWTVRDGGPAKCETAAGELRCKTGAGDIYSKEKFASAQIHLEFAIPSMPGQHGQLRGNSGVFLHGLYEVQVLDSDNNPTYANGSCGALYGQYAPLVNASRPPEQWQTYDIVLHAPKCDASGKVVQKGTLTLLQNGVLVQDHVEIKGPTGGGQGNECEPGPLRLQDHSGFKGAPVTVMRYRNIWFRPLE